jgi:uroporphyrinogen-III synthase
LINKPVFPLAGVIVLVTAPVDGASTQFCQTLTSLGAHVNAIAMIETVSIPFAFPENLSIDWLFFTSKNAVHAFFRSPILAEQPDKQWSIAVVGPGTARALKDYGRSAHFISPIANAQAAAKAFVSLLDSSSSNRPVICWPCGNRANPTLKEILNSAGYMVSPVIVYKTLSRTLSPEELQTLRHTPWSAAVFTSASAVERFADLQVWPDFSKKPVLFSIGGKTTNVLSANFPTPFYQAEFSNYESLMEKITDYFR